jgi:hypothetical protein
MSKDQYDFTLKNERRRNAKAAVGPSAFHHARSLRRSVLNGAFGRTKDRFYNQAVVGTSGVRRGSDG